MVKYPPLVSHWILCTGIVSSVGLGGHESDVTDVEELASEFLKDPHRLILLAISCESWCYLSDLCMMAERYPQRTLQTSELVIWFVNSMRRASEPFVSLNRSAGMTLTARITAVLTKPDRIEPGDEGKWLDMLHNRGEKFKRGWFCVKQPGFSELQAGVTPEQATENESRFFDTIRPWSNAEPELRARLGTKALSKVLGQVLFEVISRRFANSSPLSFSPLIPLLASRKSRTTSIGALKMSTLLCTLCKVRSQRTPCLRSTLSSANSKSAFILPRTEHPATRFE
jgi:hypothetical protein